jgi:hypothetical protein
MTMFLVEAEVFHVDGQTDVTNLIVAFRNFVKVPSSATAHTINLQPLAVAEGECVMKNFLIPKFYDSKTENLIIFGPTLKIKFMYYFRKPFQTFAKKQFDECTVICWWHVKVTLKARNITTTVGYKEKIANVVSNSGK